MEKKGIRLLLEINVESIGKHPGNGLYVRLEDGTQIDAERVMFATGRHPNTADLGLDTAGVKLDENEAVIINHHFQTSCSSVYAIGDVTNRHNLTPVAIAEGTTLSTALFGDDIVTIEYGGIPTCIFSQPNLATVGHTEESARETCPDISVYISQFTHLKQTLSKGPERTFMKLVVDNSTDRVIGAHMVGDDAGEIIQGIAIAMKAGVTKKQFDSTMGIHPTAAEEFVTMRQPAPR
jgi:glutathione reductase (NADPH)